MTRPPYGHDPDGSADDAALDALLSTAEAVVLNQLDAAVDLDWGCAKIFAASITPDQDPIPYFLRTPASPSHTEPPPLVPASSQPPAHGPGSSPRTNETGPTSPASPGRAPRHDRAPIDDESTTRPQPR